MQIPKKRLRDIGAKLGERLVSWNGPLHAAYNEILKGLKEELGTQILEEALKNALKNGGAISLNRQQLVIKLPKSATKETTTA